MNLASLPETLDREFNPRNLEIPAAEGFEPRVNDYDPVAAIFDEVMGRDFHAATHHLREPLAASVSRAGHLRCLDLCCGTGIFFELLANRFRVEGVGIDLSKGQIGVARTRRTAGLGQCKFEVGDVRTTAFAAGFDLVSINFDALNHLGSRAHWRDLFDRAYRALRLGGALILDVNLPNRLLHDWDAPEVIAKDDLVYVQLAYPARVEDGGVTRQTPMIIFQRCASGMFNRHCLLIEQFAIPLSEICELMRSCGFSDLELLQEESSLPAGHLFNKHRAFISGRK